MFVFHRTPYLSQLNVLLIHLDNLTFNWPYITICWLWELGYSTRAFSDNSQLCPLSCFTSRHISRLGPSISSYNFIRIHDYRHLGMLLGRLDVLFILIYFRYLWFFYFILVFYVFLLYNYIFFSLFLYIRLSIKFHILFS